MKLLLTFWMTLGSHLAMAEEEIIPLPLQPGDSGEEEVPFKTPTPKETAAVCKKYEGKYIGYYGRVFRVEQCAKRPVDDPDAVYQITLRKNVILGVDAQTVAALPDGKPLLDQTELGAPRSCKQLNGNYLTHNFSDMYFLENCQLYEFPDYETYIDHRKRRKALKAEVVSISFAELRKFGKTKLVPSIMDSKEAHATERPTPIDVLPIDVACKGVNGEFVSFYSLMYKVEKCRKRPVDPERALWKFSGKIKLKELTSEQWISIPDGEPLKL